MTMDVTRGFSVQVSAGELLDRIAILRIKRDRLVDSPGATAVAADIRDLEPAEAAILSASADVRAAAAELAAVNGRLWELEDEVRRHGQRGDFGPGFSAAAWAIAETNDRRSGLKQRINEAVGSRLVERKLYATG